MALKVLRPKGGHKKNKERPSGAQQNQRANRMILRRTLFLMVLCGIVAFIPLIATLYKLMIVEHGHYEALAINNQTRSTRLTAARGEIYDRNMNILAASTTVETVFIDPNEIAKEMEKPENSGLLDTIANGLSNILGVEPDFVRMQAADTKYRYKAIERKISEELADEVRTFINDNKIKGVYLETDAKRYYPYSSLGAQLLGFVSDDNIGTEGLEAYYNSYLEGVAGKVVTTKGNYGSEMPYTFEKYYDATNGDSLVLTIDTTVQSYLEKNLQAAIDRYEIQNGAFGIVMDVNSGAIVAMATLGSFDPNDHRAIYDEVLNERLEQQYQQLLRLQKGTEEFEKAKTEYNQAVTAAHLKQWRNRCVSDGYEPGSTFKVISLAEALDCGAATVNDTYYCSGAEKIADREQVVHCWKAAGHGAETTAQALGNSCNIAFGHIGVQLGGTRFYEYAQDFGITERTGVDLPGEAWGYFFDFETLTKGYASVISGAFGQTFRVTPIQQARAIAAVVNGGYVLEPYIVSQVLDADGNVVKENGRTVLRQAISESTSATMCDMMEKVVTEGTAKGAHTPGYRVGGKTGTSEKTDTFDENGKMVEDKIVSFVGVAPINDPQYVVLVALDTPKYQEDNTKYTPNGYYISGGLMAAPTVRDIFLDILPYLGVEPDYASGEIRGVNVKMPELTGMTQEEAAAALKNKSLTYRTLGTGAIVTDQIPAAGAELPGDSEVILYFDYEKSTEQVEVPDFVGYAVADVNWLANNAGVYVQAKGTDRTSYATVTYQSVEPGTKVDRGTTITVEFTDHSSLED